MAKSAFTKVGSAARKLGFVMALLAVGSLVVLLVVNVFGLGAKKAAAVVLYHSEGCGHCRKMMPAWDEAKASASATHKVLEVEAKDIQAGTVPAVAAHGAKGIKGYPTIKAVAKDGSLVAKYKGDRSASDLKAFIDEHTKATVKEGFGWGQPSQQAWYKQASMKCTRNGKPTSSRSAKTTWCCDKCGTDAYISWTVDYGDKCDCAGDRQPN